jgi:hypothetical protein
VILSVVCVMWFFVLVVVYTVCLYVLFIQVVVVAEFGVCLVAVGWGLILVQSGRYKKRECCRGMVR